MSLKDDFNEARQIWSGSSLSLKLLAGLTLFLATGSIASLSDTVFAWRGFLSDGVKFYESFITGQIIRLTDVLGLSYSQVETNTVVIMAITFGAFTRRDAASPDYDFNIPVLVLRDIVWFILAVLPMGIHSATNISSVFFYFLSLVCAVMFLWGAYDLRAKRKQWLAYISIPTLAVSFVFIAGAINTGLSRTQ